MLPVLETLHLWDGLVNIWPTFLGGEFQAHNDKLVRVDGASGPSLAARSGFGELLCSTDPRDGGVSRSDHSLREPGSTLRTTGEQARS